MAVARIFTRNPEAANSLQEELRRQGYTVEVVVPDQPAARRDTEFDFDFLRKAESPTYSDELITEFAPDTKAVAAARAPRKLTIVEVPDMVAAGMAVHQPVIAPVVMPQMPPVALVPEIAQAGTQGGVSQAEVEVVLMSPVHKLGVAFLERAQSWVNSCALFALRMIGNCRQYIHVRARHMSENRQRRLLEQQAREVQAQQLAAEVHAAQEAAAKRLQELLRERADMPPAKLATLLGDDTSWSEDKATKAIPDFSSAAFVPASAEKETVPELDMEPVLQAPVHQQPVYQQPVYQQNAEPAAGSPVLAFLSKRKLNFNFKLKPEHVWSGAVAAGALVVIGLAWTSNKSQPRLTAQLEPPAVSAPAQSGDSVKPVGQSARPARPSARNGGTKLFSLVAMDKTTTRHLGDDVTVRVYPKEMQRFVQARPAAAVSARPDFKRISDLQN